MQYFKNTNNEIFAYDDEQIAQGYGADLIPITEAEKDEMLAPTPEQLAAQAEKEAAKQRDEAMLKGFEYKGHQISVTAQDGTAMLQVKGAFEIGVTDTVIYFANGTKLPMTASEFPDFSLLFVSERNKYFTL